MNRYAIASICLIAIVLMNIAKIVLSGSDFGYANFILLMIALAVVYSVDKNDKTPVA